MAKRERGSGGKKQDSKGHYPSKCRFLIALEGGKSFDEALAYAKSCNKNITLAVVHDWLKEDADFKRNYQHALAILADRNLTAAYKDLEVLNSESSRDEIKVAELKVNFRLNIAKLLNPN